MIRIHAVIDFLYPNRKKKIFTMETITEQQREDFLRQCLQEGKYWMAYKGFDPQFHPDQVETFISALEASKYCVHGPFKETSAKVPNMNFEYSFQSVENMLLDLQQSKTSLSPAQVVGDLDSIRQAVRLSMVTPYLSGRFGDGYLQLALGRTIMGGETLQFLPSDHIDRYHILQYGKDPFAQQLKGGMVTQTLDTCEDYASAQRQFQKHAAALQPASFRQQTVLLLVGGYKGTTLEMGEEGRPILNTGFLARQYYYEDKDHLHIHRKDPTLPTSTVKDFFIRYDGELQRIVKLDDELKVLKLPLSLTSCTDHHFQVLTSRHLLDQAAHLGQPEVYPIHRTPRTMQDNDHQKGLRP
jgi:hypothetical protein